MLPSGYSYVSDDGAGAYVSGTGLWTIGAIANGGSATLNITATILASGDYSNYAQITASDQDDPDSTPDDDSDGDDDDDTDSITPTPVADLSIDKSNDGEVTVGQDVVFTLVVSNDGPSDATGVTVTDQLPSGYSYVSDDGAGAYVSGTGLWTIGAIANGGSATLNITATILASGDYSNYAQITASDQDDPDSTPDDDSDGDDDDDTDSITPTPIADLSIDKSNDGEVNVGQDVVFTLVVSNDGPSDATGVTVTDLLPSGYSYVSDDGAGAYVSGTGLWTIGAIANGGSATLNITATILLAATTVTMHRSLRPIKTIQTVHQTMTQTVMMMMIPRHRYRMQ